MNIERFRLSKERRRALALRRVSMIPALFSLGNGVCGFASIIVASRIPTSVLREGGAGYSDAMQLIGIAGWLILAGMIFDVLDGRMARLTNAASRFGAELDSLCDVVTFGVAPAFLLLKLGPTADHPILYKVLFLSATLYVMCVILRLARFNVETPTDESAHRVFKGLPSPAGAGCIATVAIMRYDWHSHPNFAGIEGYVQIISASLPFAMIGVSLLMVSTIPYAHLVNQTLRGRHTFSHLVQLLVVVAVVSLFQQLSLAIAFWGFAMLGPVRSLLQPPPKVEKPAETSQPNEEIAI